MRCPGRVVPAASARGRRRSIELLVRRVVLTSRRHRALVNATSHIIHSTTHHTRRRGRSRPRRRCR